MKYIRHDFQGNYSNFAGKPEQSKLVEDELAKVIVLRPDLVSDILNESGVKNVTLDGQKLVSLIEANAGNKKMIGGLARAVVLLNAKDENGQLANYLNSDGASERAAGATRDGSTSGGRSAGGGGAKETFGKFGSWLNKNADLVTGVATSIAAGVQSSKAAKEANKNSKSTLSNSVDNYSKDNTDGAGVGNKTVLYLGIGAIVLIAAVGGIFVYLSKQKQSQS